MKTEPTGKEKLIERLEVEISNCQDDLDAASWAYEEDILISKRDAVALLDLAQSSPKIKQLEWKEYENLRGRRSYFAKTPFSPYEVADGGDHYTMFSPDKRLRFASADEAKAAAQADFEKRVRECLE